jgi:GT2 family glycosyltransferase
VLFRRAALEHVRVEGQFFDEDFFAYYEDLDLGWRLRQAGFENGYTPRAVAFHVRGGSAGEAKFFRKDPERQRLTMRNRYFLLIKNLPCSQALVFLPFLLLTEGALLIYSCTRAPHLLSVYGEVGRNLARMREKRLSIQRTRPSV